MRNQGSPGGTGTNMLSAMRVTSSKDAPRSPGRMATHTTRVNDATGERPGPEEPVAGVPVILTLNVVWRLAAPGTPG
jgi:hypothetical protein